MPPRNPQAIKTIAKKELKVKEITALLDEEITPKLDKLREEKRSFLEYQKATSELERLTRLAKAHEWQTLKSKHEEKSQYVAQQSTEVNRRRKHIEALQRQIASIDEELTEIERKREKEIAKGGKLKALIEKSKTLQHDVVKTKTSLDFKTTSYEEEQKKLAADVEALGALQQAREAKAQEVASLSSSFASLKAAHDASTSELSRNDELLQSLLTGMASKKQAGGGGQGGYMGQLADSRAAEASARTEVEQAKLRISSLEKEVKTKEPQARKAEKEGAGLIKQLESAQAEVEKMAASLAASGWDEGKERASAQRKHELTRSLNGLLETRDRLKSRLVGVDFSYSDPEPNFDRSRVKGLVASLIDLAEDRHKYSTALEICAGGRLYNVVVEDEVTGSKLLSNGKLKKRVTLIPLNKINAFVAASQRVGAAQKIAGDPSKVDLALSLVGYDDEVSKAMEYVFGNTLICADAQTAKRVTFDNAVKMKSVTLEGDVYDPAGTLSGGSKPQSGGLLVKLQELRGIERQIKAAKDEVAQIERSEQGDAKYAKVKRTLDLKRHEVTLLQEQINGSNATRILGEVAAAREAIAELQQSIVASQERQKTAAAEAKRLEKEMKEFESNKDSKIDELKAKVKKMKAALQKQSVSFQGKQTEVRTTELELEGATKEVEEAEAALEEAKAAVKASEAGVAAMEKELQKKQADADATEALLKKERAALSAFDEEANALQAAAKSKKQEIADSELEVKQLKHDLDKAEQDCSAVEKGVKAIEAQFEWILEEHHLFGQPGSAYDFRKHNMTDVRRNCKKLEEQHSGLKKKVNPKVLNLIDSVEKKESELKTMLSTVLGDKSKIEETIGELDRYKRDALHTTWLVAAARDASERTALTSLDPSHHQQAKGQRRLWRDLCRAVSTAAHTEQANNRG